MGRAPSVWPATRGRSVATKATGRYLAAKAAGLRVIIRRGMIARRRVVIRRSVVVEPCVVTGSFVASADPTAERMRVRAADVPTFFPGRRADPVPLVGYLDDADHRPRIQL